MSQPRSLGPLPAETSEAEPKQAADTALFSVTGLGAVQKFQTGDASGVPSTLRNAVNVSRVPGKASAGSLFTARTRGESTRQ